VSRLRGKAVAMVIAQEYEDLELFYPLLRLSEEGADILVAAVRMGAHTRPYIEGKLVTGRFGHPMPMPIMREGRRYRMVEVEDLRADAIDCLLIPGGFSPDWLRRHKPTLALTRECHEQGKIVAAICHGPWVLISAGVVRGRRTTASRALVDDLTNAGAEFVDEPAVRDGNVVTAQGPSDLPEFCQEIIHALAGDVAGRGRDVPDKDTGG